MDVGDRPKRRHGRHFFRNTAASSSPLVIGVDAPWGGKSSLMKALRRGLDPELDQVATAKRMRLGRILKLLKNFLNRFRLDALIGNRRAGLNLAQLRELARAVIEDPGGGR